jgi:phage shock protein A
VEKSKTADWERKAMMAVRAGDDALAREALARKGEHEESATTLGKQWELHATQVGKLKNTLRALNSKIEEAKRKKNILIARKKRAEAQKTIHETMSGLSDTSAFETFDRMANQIDQLEAEAEAGAEISGQLTGDSLERKFDQLEAGHGGDQALLELKAKMGLLAESTEGGAPEQISAGEAASAPDPDVIEDELAALKAQVEGSGNKE